MSKGLPWKEHSLVGKGRQWLAMGKRTHFNFFYDAAEAWREREPSQKQPWLPPIRDPRWY